MYQNRIDVVMATIANYLGNRQYDAHIRDVGGNLGIAIVDILRSAEDGIVVYSKILRLTHE